MPLHCPRKTKTKQNKIKNQVKENKENKKKQNIILKFEYTMI